MKFTMTNAIDLNLEGLVLTNGEDCKTLSPKPSFDMSYNNVLKIIETFVNTGTDESKSYVERPQANLELLAAVYDKPASWFGDNLMPDQIAEIVNYVRDTLMGVKKKEKK